MLQKCTSMLILSLMLVLGSINVSFAQTEKMSTFRKLKIEMVLHEMQLNSLTEANFLPLYNKYADEYWNTKSKIKQIEKSSNDPKYIIAERQKIDEDLVKLKGKYQAEFLKIITPAQLENMYKGEEAFRKAILKKHMERK